MQLELVYLMNVLLYFSSIDDVLSFLQISHKTQEVVRAMKINPLLQHCSVSRIKQLFSNLQTYQCIIPFMHSTSSIHKDIHTLTTITYIDCNITQYPQVTLPIFPFPHNKLLRLSLPSLPSDPSLLTGLSSLTSLRISLRSADLQKLSVLRPIIRLKKIVIHIIDAGLSTSHINFLKNLLPNAHITLTVPFIKHQDVPQSSIIKNSNILVFFTKLTTNALQYPLIHQGFLECCISAFIQNQLLWKRSLERCYPTHISIIFDVENKTTTQQLDFSELPYIQTMSLHFTQYWKCEIKFPLYLTKLKLSNPSNSPLPIDLFENLPLIDLSLLALTDQQFILPTTLKHFTLSKSKRCKFSSKATLVSMDVNATGCILPLCSSLETMRIIHKNTFEIIGEQTPIIKILSLNCFKWISYSSTTLAVELDKTIHMKSFDLSNINVNRVTVKGLNADIVLFGSKHNVAMEDCSCSIVKFDYVNYIDITIRRTVYLTTISGISSQRITLNTPHSFDSCINCDVEYVDLLHTNCMVNISGTCYKALIFNMDISLLDLSPMTISCLVLSKVTLEQLSLPNKLQQFTMIRCSIETICNIEKTLLAEKMKKKLCVDYSCGIFPPISLRKVTISNKSYQLIDLRLLKCRFVRILHCPYLEELYLPLSVHKIHIDDCEELESFEATGTSLRSLCVRNCNELRSVVVCSKITPLFYDCPLLGK
ncbi:hypothetical protein QTN25_004303 [Entamoeba marina]